MIEIRLPRGVWRYDPETQLGIEGGFGAVYSGLGLGDLPVAVKRLHIHAEEAAHRELKIAEDLATRELAHIIPILDAGQDAESDAYFVIMPIAARSLQEHLEHQGPLSEADVRLILRQVVLGLEEVPHLVHRDLKPGNILLIEDTWRIADFGIAKFVEDSTSARTLRQYLSPHYAAPEQWRGERATTATDVYALGCVAHCMLAGSPPFMGSREDVCEQHLQSAPPELSCSSHLRMLIGMMLRKEVRARPSLARIRSVLTRLGSPEEAESPRRLAIDSLAAAAAVHESKVAKLEAQIRARKAAAAERKALATEAYNILQDIFRQLAEQVTSAIPGAVINDRSDAIHLRIGGAFIEMEWRISGEVIDDDAFPASSWNVVCDGKLTAVQLEPRFMRSANLWFTNKPTPTDFRWCEVAYQGNRLTSTRFAFEPSAASIQQADCAQAPGMDVFEIAYGPVPIDGEDAEGFFSRWTRILAAACEGKLSDLPLLP